MEKKLESRRKVNLKGEYLAKEKLFGGKRHNKMRVWVVLCYFHD